MNNQKRYLIKLFIERSSSTTLNKEFIDFLFVQRKKVFQGADADWKKISDKYSVKYFLDCLSDVIDLYLTEDDLRAALKFYSSPSGKKIMDINFIRSLASVGEKFVSDLDKELATIEQK